MILRCLLCRASILLNGLAFFALPPAVGAQSTPAARRDSAAVASAVRHFLTAFENLDWEPFHTAFSDSATVFHPAANTPERVTGRAAIDSTFRAVFADVRAHASGGPPFQRLTPADLRIQPLAPGVVLVTFELRNPERLGRRTVVFARERDAWRIVHLHASNIATPSPG
jgi:ketosteroid isomerase-like protein